MASSRLLVFAAWLGALGLVETKARADIIHWSYQWSATPTILPNPYPNPTNGQSSIRLDVAPQAQAIGSSSLLPVRVTYPTGPTTAVPQDFLPFDSRYSRYQLSLSLRDSASGNSGTVVFAGYFNGGMNPTNSFAGPMTQSIQLGSDLYTVSMEPFSGWVNRQYRLGPNSYRPYEVFAVGSFSAVVDAQPVQHAAPEPPAGTLAGLGISLLGLAAWSQRTAGLFSSKRIQSPC